ncbi:hypothetical protein [Leptospira yasudae]|uniref:DUF1499 domain-containing protein n=1 Tax=Leptospira yasudae TaxID=2202201 RepID=A0ABX9M446_9LEPT|nr:hypothetical protein [Leptospira yasudae]RHX80115.1 hypothetical protein DLM77_09640 [Leptospira yasudae]
MNQKAKRLAAFFGATGLTVALVCFTVMLSGNHCPAWAKTANATVQNNLPPCHQTEKAKDPVPTTCSSCDLVVSQESIHPKSPELDRNYFSVLSSIQDVFRPTFGKFLVFPPADSGGSKYNAQKSVLISISSVRLLI